MRYHLPGLVKWFQTYSLKTARNMLVSVHLFVGSIVEKIQKENISSGKAENLKVYFAYFCLQIAIH
jgi:hypothetical protein